MTRLLPAALALAATTTAFAAVPATAPAADAWDPSVSLIYGSLKSKNLVAAGTATGNVVGLGITGARRLAEDNYGYHEGFLSFNALTGSTESGTVKADTSLFQLIAGYNYNFEAAQDVLLYAGPRLGATHETVSLKNAPGAKATNGNDFLYGLGLGAKFKLAPKWSLDVGYDWQHLGSPLAWDSASNPNTKIAQSAHLVHLAVHFSF